MSDENVEIARRLLDAFNRNDVRGVIAEFDERCELDEPPEMPDRPAQGFRGHDGIREWMANLRGIGAIHFEPRGFRTSSDVVVCEVAASGEGQASGVPFEWATFAVLRTRDGKIVRAQAFLSEDEALQAAGLSE